VPIPPARSFLSLMYRIFPSKPSTKLFGNILSVQILGFIKPYVFEKSKSKTRNRRDTITNLYILQTSFSYQKR